MVSDHRFHTPEPGTQIIVKIKVTSFDNEYIIDKGTSNFDK